MFLKEVGREIDWEVGNRDKQEQNIMTYTHEKVPMKPIMLHANLKVNLK